MLKPAKISTAFRGVILIKSYLYGFDRRDGFKEDEVESYISVVLEIRSIILLFSLS